MTDRAKLWALTATVILGTLSTAAEAESKKIGVVLPLSGSMSIVGTAIQNGMQVANEGGQSVELVFEDDAYSPRNTVLAVERLIDDRKVDGLVVFGSGPSLAVAAIAEQRRVPLISIAMNDRVTEGRQYVFRLYMSSETQNAAVSAEVRRRGYQRVAVVLTTADAMIPLRDKFAATDRGRFIMSHDVLPGETDLRAAALKVRSANPDAVYVLLLQSQIGPFAQQLRGIGFRGALFGAVQACSNHEMRAAKGALDGGWCVGFEDSAAEEFDEGYRLRFGEDPLPEALLGYEVARIYSQAAKGEILDFLKPGQVISGGVLGRYTLGSDHTFELGATIKLIKGETVVSTAMSQ